MAVANNSRYSLNKLLPITDAVGTTRTTIIIEPPDQSDINFSTYTWREGDQIEYLAWSAYGDEEAWWVIADANPEIMFWNDLAIGTNVRVPRVQ